MMSPSSSFTRLVYLLYVSIELVIFLELSLEIISCFILLIQSNQIKLNVVLVTDSKPLACASTGGSWGTLWANS